MIGMAPERQSQRRSVSITNATYTKIKNFCETNGISMSSFVEERVQEFFNEGKRDPVASIHPDVEQTCCFQGCERKAEGFTKFGPMCALHYEQYYDDVTRPGEP